ncbi:MAG: DUF58 domain-containing protein [Euzebyaceae bacterium]|nr:DUF58 domain-containing protein [Euzebyaceae bacterium]
MLTARGTTLLVGAVLLWLVGRLLGVPELHVVGLASAALVAAGAFVVHLSTSTISARRTVTTPRMPAGGTGEVVLELRNDARLPSSLLLVEDDCQYGLADSSRFVVPGLGPGRTVTLRYTVTGAARGRYKVGPLRVHIRDPFGTTQRVRRYTSTADLLVYPRIEPLPERAVRGNHHGSGSSETRRLFSTGDEFYTMREYVQGDDLRQVHWPSTAHRQTLMVRQQEQPWQAQATIFCDSRRAAHAGSGADSSLEKAISVAASVAWHLADRGYQLRLVTDADHRSVGPERWETVLDRLAELQASKSAGVAPALQRVRGGEGLFVAVVAPPPGHEPVARHPDARTLLQCGRGYTGRVALVVVAAGGERRAKEFATLLAAAGWKAATIAPGQELADRWRAAMGEPTARTAGRTA